MYKVILSNKFKRDLKRIKKQGYDINKLLEIIDKIANNENIEKKYKKHSLKGNYKGYDELHIAPDWLLIYKINNDILILTLLRTGSHSELFNM